MLTVDLGTLARQHRIRIDADVPADDPAWAPLPWTFDGPVSLRLDVQHAGADVLARGRVRAVAALSCRRCLVPVLHAVDEELTLLYKEGLPEVEAEAAEVYTLPERGRDLDLGPAVLEHVLLAIPQFVLCDEECRGFCARCGTNLNQTSCDCVDEDADPRWSALRQLGSK
ncbi:MAG: DUF177 domain-containing protein [Gemmatimonadota bacterium]